MKKHTYIFSILSIAVFSLAAFTLTASAGAEPSNDNFAAAETLVLNNGAFVGTRNNIGATEEAGEPNHTENIGGRSVWFSITPTVTQVYRITTMNVSTNFDTLLAVYKGGAMASLIRVGYNDDCYATGCDTSSMVDLKLDAGTTYRIAVDGYNVGTTPTNAAHGNFVLSITGANTPVAYDHIATPYNLGSIGNASIAGTNHFATAEVAEPGAYGNLGGKSVWYRFQVGSRRAMTVEFNPDFAGEAAVYSSPIANPPVAQLQRLDDIATHFANNHGRYTMNFTGEANKYYFVQVDYNSAGNASETGNFQLKMYKSKMRYSTRLATRTNEGAVSVFRPSNATFYDLRATNLQGGVYTKFGFGTDTPVPADFDGDGLSNHAVTRNQNGLKQWYILDQTSETAFTSFQWGLSTDKEVTGDFDNDGIADAAVIRSVNGNLVWYVRRSSTGNMRAFVYGLSSDRPVIGDFDGDGATEIAVVREVGAELVWYMLMSQDGWLTYTTSVVKQFGAASDLPAAEDFDGDGKTDLAVFRPSTGTWMILRSATGELQVTQFGSALDYPQPGDYDGDRKADLAVYRPSTGRWYFWKSADNSQEILHWGTPGDKAVSSSARFSRPEPNE